MADIKTGMVLLSGCRCRCGHEWLPRNKLERPKVCPKCKSPNWDSPRLDEPPAPMAPPKAEAGSAEIKPAPLTEKPSAPAEEKPAESKEAPAPVTRMVSRKCTGCGERFEAEFTWSGPHEPAAWYANCPKCGALNVLERPNWAPSSAPEPEQNP